MPGDATHGAPEPTALAPPAVPAIHPSELPRGSTLGRYVILGPLGRGGTGAVYSAYDTQLDRRVALKLLRGGGENDEHRSRLMREAQAMARLSHPNVVTVYDVSVADDGRVFLAMEIVEGGTLGDWLAGGPATKPGEPGKRRPRTKRAQGWREVVRVLCDAGEGLAAAHRAGIIHRDFKLDNVLMANGERPKVTDFGLARAARAEGAAPAGQSSPPHAPRPLPALPALPAHLSPTSSSFESASFSATLTLSGALLGTPGYMAPEQYDLQEQEGQVDARADVFAFCATVYRALYGERAFEGETFEQIAVATLAGKIRRPPKRSPVPAWVHKIVIAGLSPDRNARPGSIDDVLAALRSDSVRTRRRWGFAGGAALAILCLVALGARAFGSRERKAEGGAAIAVVRPLAADQVVPGAEDAPARSASEGPAESVAATEELAGAAEGRASAPALSVRTPRRNAPTPTTQTAASPHGKARATSPPTLGPHPAHASAATCTVEANYDAEGAPHFKRVCN